MCDANCFVASFNAKKNGTKSFVSGEQQRRALAERGVTVVAKSPRTGRWLNGHKTQAVTFTSLGITADGVMSVGVITTERRFTRLRNMIE